MTERKNLYLVDGSGFIFRAYHALPPLTRASDGLPVGAVLGFVNMLTKLLADMKAPYVAVIFDAARRNFRYDIYDRYKANREEPPEDLVPQFPYFRRAAEAFGLPAIEQDGYEADDLIAAYARIATEAGWDATIVGSDKDLMQLVGDHVRMYDPMKGKMLGREDVIEKFGVPPDKVVDVQALAGDATDNVPGVPGIGIKTAAQLITEYGDLETLLARAGEIKQPKRREALEQNAENARISKRLVKLDDRAPVPLALEDLKSHDLNAPTLAPFLQEMGFKSALARLESAGTLPPSLSSLPPSQPPPFQGGGVSGEFSTLPRGEVSGESQTEGCRTEGGHPPLSENQYTLIADAKTLQRWIDEAFERGVLAVDTETTDLTPAKARLVGISLASTPGRAAYIPLGHVQGGGGDLFDTLAPSPQPSPQGGEGDIAQMDAKEALALLKPLLEDESVLKIGHNLKYDWQMFAKHGVEISPCEDTMLLSYGLDGSAHGHGMDELSELMLGHATIHYEDVAGKGKDQVTFDRVPIEKALTYAAEDADVTLRLWHILKPRLAREHMVSVYEDIERPLIPVIARMELEGIRVDPAVLRSMSGEFGHKLAALEAEIHKLAGHPFNVGSPKQVGEVLFGEMGMEGGKKTKTGDWSTRAGILEDLAEQGGHEIVRKILDWRQLSKLKSTYTDALPGQINPDTGRVHTSFAMALTNTGRLSSSDPNLQNIPIRTEEGRRIREAFIAQPGWKILSVDYSQVELRLAAELAGVEALKEAFRNHIDIHAMTAARVFGVPLDQVTPDLRRQAKTVNFGIIYGISAWGLAQQLGCPQADAAALIRTYMSRFSELQDYMEAKREEARKNGFVRTLYGRKCVIAGINDKNGAVKGFAERQAINAPLQGTAADIMKKAMIRMPRALADAGLQARMLLQVHDELVFEAPENECEKTADLVRYVMQAVANIGVPLEAEAGWADNWAQAH